MKLYSLGVSMSSPIIICLQMISFVLAVLTTDVDARQKIKIVTTIGQITNVTEIIGGDYVDVQGLMGPGVDPHLYKASESDVMKLANAQIIFYNGLNLEAKMGEIFARMGGGQRTVAVTSDLPDQLLLTSEQFQGHPDPHVWFDVTLWMNVVEKVASELALFDPSNAAYYHERAQKYLKELDALHSDIKIKTTQLAPGQRVIVTAHDAFRYFGRAYGFEVVGLQGISTESEAGAADIKELADFITERKIKAIFVESSVPERNIKAVQEAVRARGWGVKIGGELFSDAMGTQGTFEGTYIGMVTHNINTIVNALK